MRVPHPFSWSCGLRATRRSPRSTSSGSPISRRQASIAMELAAARADRQRMLLLEDRNRIARDLHDHVIQQLFATGLELQSIEVPRLLGDRRRPDRSQRQFDRRCDRPDPVHHLCALASEQRRHRSEEPDPRRRRRARTGACAPRDRGVLRAGRSVGDRGPRRRRQCGRPGSADQCRQACRVPTVSPSSSQSLMRRSP